MMPVHMPPLKMVPTISQLDNNIDVNSSAGSKRRFILFDLNV